MDIQVLLLNERTGLYHQVLNWVTACQGAGPRHWVAGFVALYDRPFPTDLRPLRRSLPTVPVRSFTPPFRLRRLREFLAPFNRLDVFQHTCSLGFPASPEKMNSFLIPDLTSIHFPQFHPGTEHWRSLLKRARDWGDLIITYSEHTRRDASATLGIPAEKVRVIPLAASAEYRPLPAEQVDLALGRLGLVRGGYVLSVGTLEPRKNHALLLQAFARLKGRGAVRRHKLVFAGPKGWLYEPIFEMIRSLGLEGDVVVTGHTDHLPELYNGAAVMVYPSFYEGFGLPPLEAMACGTPVITSNASSLPEVLGGAAPMVDPHDERGLADAVEAFLSDGELRRKTAARCLERARSFSWAKTAAELLAAYEEFYRSWKAR
jgi:glycosyltransferase involved in cell wall biosynthesis